MGEVSDRVGEKRWAFFFLRKKGVLRRGGIEDWVYGLKGPPTPPLLGGLGGGGGRITHL